MTALGRAQLVAMLPRDPAEPGRVASSLELFFDLVFVVAVAAAGGSLHHELASGHVADGVSSYLLVFFAIWWAWMNFTWFASAFDTDDWLYRVLALVQMAGVLVLAAGVEAAFQDGDLAVVTAGYVVMRAAMVAQWLRAARHPEMRAVGHTYALGIALAQVGWLARLALPESAWLTATLALIAVELAIPVVAERRSPTPWHPHHISERYGLFTLILLGESLLASSDALFEVIHGDHVGDLIPIGVVAFVVTAALWWLYFWTPHHHAVGARSGRASFLWGYGHYVVFAAVGALSAGIEVLVDSAADHVELSDTAASFALATPIAVFLLSVWLLGIRAHADRGVRAAVPVAGLFVVLAPLTPAPEVLTTLVMVLLVAALVISDPATHAGQPA